MSMTKPIIMNEASFQYAVRFSEDIALYADILEAFRRGAAEVVYDSDTALLLKHRTYNLYMLAAEEKEARPLFDRIEAAASNSLARGYVVARGEGVAAYAKKLGYESTTALTQVLYEKTEAPGIEKTLVIRMPDDRDFEKVTATYDIVADEELWRDFKSGEFFGGYKDGRMVGYIGLHAEGSMGMLHVFEEYRGNGYAKELYSFLIDWQLKRGRIPYGQVFQDNEASIALQKSFGLTFSKEPVYWLWK